tara:strand:+ start:214 stop:351 length:138 start_codon:yes stop_codon:yes gene_type:complete
MISPCLAELIAKAFLEALKLTIAIEIKKFGVYARLLLKRLGEEHD